MKKILLFILTILMMTGALFAADCSSVLNEQQTINWSKFRYEVVGYGVMKTSAEEPNRAKALTMAEKYARMDAMAQLLIAIQGTNFGIRAQASDLDTYVEEMVLEAKGHLKGVKFEKGVKVSIDGGERVEVRATMSMDNDVVGNIFNKSLEEDYNVIKNINPSNIPQPKVNIEIDQPIVIAPASNFPVDIPNKGFNEPKGYVPASPSSSIPYTGVIFDLKNFKLNRSMSPKIRIPNGDIVWCGANFDTNALGDRGILAYCNTLADAKHHQYAGPNPLVINAIGVLGNSRFKTDIVISAEDAAILKMENAKGKFLDNFNVLVTCNNYAG